MDGNTTTATDPKANGAGQASAAEPLQPGQAKASAGEGKSPSQSPPETFTAEQVAQRHSALDKKIASLTKSHELKTKENDELKKRLSAVEASQRAREEEEAKADPAKHSIWQQKEEARILAENRKRELDERETKIKAEEDKLIRADELELDNIFISAAVENHLDIESFKAKCQKFGLKTQEQINDFAKELVASGAGNSVPGVDSGKTLGGGVGWRDLSPDEKVRLGTTRK